MTQTSGITSNGTAVSADTSITNPASAMGENDFLKLLVAQLQYQDPMNPTGNDQFMQEQAQFSTVEGINNLQTTMKSMQSDQELAQSVALIGKQVTYVGSDGSSTASGVVSSVVSANGSLTLDVGGASVTPSSIVMVEAAPHTSTTSTGSTDGSTSTSTSTGTDAATTSGTTGTDAGSVPTAATDGSTTGA